MILAWFRIGKDQVAGVLWTPHEFPSRPRRHVVNCPVYFVVDGINPACSSERPRFYISVPAVNEVLECEVWSIGHAELLPVARRVDPETQHGLFNGVIELWPQLRAQRWT